MSKSSEPSTIDHHPDQFTIWDILTALSGLDDYAGRINPRTKEVELCRLDELPARASLITRERVRTQGRHDDKVSGQLPNSRDEATEHKLTSP